VIAFLHRLLSGAAVVLVFAELAGYMVLPANIENVLLMGIAAFFAVESMFALLLAVANPKRLDIIAPTVLLLVSVLAIKHVDNRELFLIAAVIFFLFGYRGGAVAESGGVHQSQSSG